MWQTLQRIFMSQVLPNRFLCPKPYKTAFHVTGLTKSFSMSQALPNCFPCRKPYKIILYVTSSPKPLSMSQALQKHFSRDKLCQTVFRVKNLTKAFLGQQFYKTAFMSQVLQKHFSCDKLGQTVFRVTRLWSLTKHFSRDKFCQTVFRVTSLTKAFPMSLVLQNRFPCDRPYKIVFLVTNSAKMLSISQVL